MGTQKLHGPHDGDRLFNALAARALFVTAKQTPRGEERRQKLPVDAETKTQHRAGRAEDMELLFVPEHVEFLPRLPQRTRPIRGR